MHKKYLLLLVIFALLWKHGYSQHLYQKQYGSQALGHAQVVSPWGMAWDNDGNMYVLVYGQESRVVKMSRTGTFLGQFGGRGSADGQFLFPTGIAVDATGNVYVCDAFNNRIQKFSKEGAFVSKFGSYGTGNGQFSNPAGVSIDASGSIYVCDRDNHRIQKFNSSGVYQSQFGTSGTGNGQFNKPVSLAFDASGNIYVVENGNNRIQKFNSSGEYSSQFGTAGSGDGQFNQPAWITIDASDNLYVADYQNYRIQKFTSSGGFISKFNASGRPTGILLDGGNTIYVSDQSSHLVRKFNSAGVLQSNLTGGSGDGEFFYPYGLTLDANNNIYTTESNNARFQKISNAGVFQLKGGNGLSAPNCIKLDAAGNIYVLSRNNNQVHKYNSAGVFQSSFGSTGSADGQFTYPSGIALDADKNIYVADPSNSRIQKFSNSGTFISKFGASGTGEGQLSGLNSIVIDAEGNIYATTSSRVQKFTNAGVFISQFGNTATTAASGKLASAKGLTLDSKGNVYVADESNMRIAKYSGAGVYLGEFGAQGINDGQLMYPNNVAVDTQDNVYVTDTYNHRIQKFSSYSIKQATITFTYGNTYSFGNIQLPASKTSTFTISNEGALSTLHLTGSKVFVTGTHAGDFTLDLSETDETIAPGGSTTFKVTYLASTSGTRKAVLNIECSDVYPSTVMVNLTATDEKDPQSITFPTIASHTFGDEPFTISATASSELPVSFQIVSGPATISGNTITLTGGGTVKVRATQAGDDIYNAAPAVEQTFTVIKLNAEPVLAAIGPKTVDEMTTLSFTAAATDTDEPADILTYSVVGTLPQGATLNSTTGAFNWSPSEQQGPAAYTFTIRVTNNSTTPGSDEEEITITVKEANVIPVATSTPAISVLEDQLYSYTLTATDADLPANTLTYAATQLPSWLQFNSEGNVLSGTPDNTHVGLHSVTLTISDGTRTVEQAFTIEVINVNDAPTISAIENSIVNEDETVSISFEVEDVDNAPASLQLRASTSNSALIPVAAISFSGSGKTRTLSFTPVKDAFGGPVQLTLEVSDGQLQEVSEGEPKNITTFNVTVLPVNDAPTMESVATKEHRINQPKQTLTLTGITAGPAAEATQELRLSVSTDNSQLITATEIVYHNNGTATLSYTPVQSTTLTGNATLTVLVKDNGGTERGGVDTKAVSITVTILPPNNSLFIPNLFSPDGNSSNEAFTVLGEGVSQITFRVFNKLGIMVYESSSVEEATTRGWDGTYQGKQQPAGVYTWQVAGSFADGSPLQFDGKKSGSVLLTR